MTALPAEVLCEIFGYLAYEDLIKVSRVSRLWNDCSREFIWEKPRFVKKISLDKLVEMDHLPVKELRTADISDFEDGINPASVILLSSLVKMKKLILDHFGKLTNDELELIFALPCKLELCSTLLYETLKHIEDEDSFLVSLKERNVQIRFCTRAQGLGKGLYCTYLRDLDIVYLEPDSMWTYTDPARWTCACILLFRRSVYKNYVLSSFELT